MEIWPLVRPFFRRAAVFGSRSAAILGISSIVHLLTIAAIWSLGRAQGLALSPTDAAVLSRL